MCFYTYIYISLQKVIGGISCMLIYIHHHRSNIHSPCSHKTAVLFLIICYIHSLTCLILSCMGAAGRCTALWPSVSIHVSFVYWLSCVCVSSMILLEGEQNLRIEGFQNCSKNAHNLKKKEIYILYFKAWTDIYCIIIQ